MGLYSWGRVVAVHTPPRAVDATRTVDEPEKLPGLSGSFPRGQQSISNRSNQIRILVTRKDQFGI